MSNSTNPSGKPPKGYHLIVRDENALLPFLLDMLDQQSRSSVKSLLHNGHIQVNGEVTTKFDTPLIEGDKIFVSSESNRKEELMHPMLQKVWEDDDLVVVNKREGLLSVTSAPGQRMTAFNILAEHYHKINQQNNVYVLHRLDRGTSGLMMFARTTKAYDVLKADWHSMITKRAYIAVIEGRPLKDEDTIVTYLAENDRMKVFCTDPMHGKNSISHYRLLKYNNWYSMLELELETGRKNQIRAQMEYLGHPIAGDYKYGAHTDPDGRIMLHAQSLHFIHPISGEEMKFDHPAPKSFFDVVKE